jgi:Matrixin
MPNSMKIRTRFAVLAAAVAVATVFSSDSTAFVLSGPKWAATTVPYYINTANMDLPGSAVEAAVRFGADTWPAQAGVGFRFSFAGQSSQTTNTNDGVNLVTFRNASSGSAIATAYWYSSGGRITDADIIFWDGGFRFFAGTTGCSAGFYIEDVAAHEFGHALGLLHSAATAATMYPSISTCSQASRTLDADDIAGVRALYPPASQGPTAPTGFRIVS